MPVSKFVLDPDSTEGDNAFVFIDLEDSTVATGVLRSAKKVLIDGARTLARSETYAWALIGLPYSGASGGINVTSGDSAGALSAFSDHLATDPPTTTLILRNGRGLPASPTSIHDELLARSVVSATSACLGDMDGRTVTVESGASGSDQITALLTEHGATVEKRDITDLASSQGDALIYGSKAGLIDHTIAATVPHAVMVPLGPSPLTARAFAVLRSKGTTVIPAFLSVSGPLFAHRDEVAATRSAEEINSAGLAPEVAEFIATRCSDFLAHPEGPYMAACYAAEEFMRSWRDEPPFGRPLA